MSEIKQQDIYILRNRFIPGSKKDLILKYVRDNVTRFPHDNFTPQRLVEFLKTLFKTARKFIVANLPKSSQCANLVDLKLVLPQQTQHYLYPHMLWIHNHRTIPDLRYLLLYRGFVRSPGPQEESIPTATMDAIWACTSADETVLESPTLSFAANSPKNIASRRSTWKHLGRCSSVLSCIVAEVSTVATKCHCDEGTKTYGWPLNRWTTAFRGATSSSEKLYISFWWISTR